MFQTVFYITAKGHPLDIIIYIYSIWQGGVRMDQMNNQELCILLNGILALLETDNVDKAKEVIKKGIIRIDKEMTSNTKQG